MVMRQTGNYRLLLNAKVYPGMSVQPMAGGVGVSFACVNHCTAADAPSPNVSSGWIRGRDMCEAIH